MIHRLEIEGFKSFGTPGVSLQFTDLNFLVGANSSGKSNLISALRFVQDCVNQNVEYAVNELGGGAEVRNKILRQRTDPKPVRFKIIGTPSGTLGRRSRSVPFAIGRWHSMSFTYEVKLDLRSEDGIPVIESEVFTAESKDKNTSRKQEYLLARDEKFIEIKDPTRPDYFPGKIAIDEPESTRLALGKGFFGTPPTLLRREIESWRFYNVSPSVARQPSKETGDVELGPAGENLAVILHRIEKENSVHLQAILHGLRGVVPGFKGIRTRQLPVETKWAFQVLEDKIRGAINPSSVSDGTIRLLTLLVITTWSSRYSALVAVEEPENGLHPHLYDHVVNLFREASQHRQFIVATHNPSFLDQLSPEEVFLCDKLEGFTQIRVASSLKMIQSFKKHFQLGELWIQGVLGANP